METIIIEKENENRFDISNLVEDLHIILDKKELIELFMQTAKSLGIERDDLELLMILCSNIEECDYTDESLERTSKLVDSIRNILIP